MRGKLTCSSRGRTSSTLLEDQVRPPSPFSALPLASPDTDLSFSRLAVLQTQALIEALQSGHLAGAGLDVFDIETSEGIDPWLLASDKVTLTPHFACNIDSIYPCTSSLLSSLGLCLLCSYEVRLLIGLLMSCAQTAVESEQSDNVRLWALGDEVNICNSWE